MKTDDLNHPDTLLIQTYNVETLDSMKPKPSNVFGRNDVLNWIEKVPTKCSPRVGHVDLLDRVDRVDRVYRMDRTDVMNYMCMCPCRRKCSKKSVVKYCSKRAQKVELRGGSIPKNRRHSWCEQRCTPIWTEPRIKKHAAAKFEIWSPCTAKIIERWTYNHNHLKITIHKKWAVTDTWFYNVLVWYQCEMVD